MALQGFPSTEEQPLSTDSSHWALLAMAENHICMFYISMFYMYIYAYMYQINPSSHLKYEKPLCRVWLFILIQIRVFIHDDIYPFEAL